MLDNITRKNMWEVKTWSTGKWHVYSKSMYERKFSKKVWPVYQKECCESQKKEKKKKTLLTTWHVS